VSGRYEKSPDFLFINYADYGFIKVILDSLSLNYSLKYLDKFESPLLRQLLWQTFYDMTRDAKILTTYDFINLAIEKINFESDKKLIQTILERLQACLDKLIKNNNFE